MAAVIDEEADSEVNQHVAVGPTPSKVNRERERIVVALSDNVVAVRPIFDKRVASIGGRASKACRRFPSRTGREDVERADERARAAASYRPQLATVPAFRVPVSQERQKCVSGQVS